MKSFRQQDYLYAVGRVRSLERYLVQRAVFVEAAAAADAGPALKVIADNGRFSEDLENIRDSRSLESLLEKEEAGLVTEMTELCRARDLLDMFLAGDDPAKALSLAEEWDSFFLREYHRRRVDLGNLKVFLRSRYLGLSGEAFGRKMIKAGTLPARLFLDNFEMPLPEFGALLKPTPYAELWKRAVDALSGEDTFAEWERGADDLLVNFLKQAKAIVFGPEPVFAYGAARRHELGLVRLVGLGKLFQLPAEMLRTRISETYA